MFLSKLTVKHFNEWRKIKNSGGHGTLSKERDEIIPVDRAILDLSAVLLSLGDWMSTPL